MARPAEVTLLLLIQSSGRENGKKSGVKHNGRTLASLSPDQGFKSTHCCWPQ